jgi:hypothetical protein
MLTPPKQDWNKYEMLTRASDADWVRQLSPRQRFEIYQDIYDFVMAARKDRGDWVKLESWSWEEKIAVRRRVATCLQEADRIRERS